MPKLKQLFCFVEHADSNMPFSEYGTSYGDGFVQTHIVVPAAPIPFTLRLSSIGYIAPGLAMFVFMDGVYQCNRNVDGLVPPNEATERSQTEIDFRVRQKEQMLSDDTWLGREWRFEKFNIVTGEPCNHQHPPSPDISHLGYIEVVVLRCLNSADSAAASPLKPVSTPPNKGDTSRVPGTEPSSPTLDGLFFDGAVDCRLPKHVSFGYDGIEDQSVKSESKTVRFGENESRDQFQDGNNIPWDYSYTGPGTGTWHALDGSYDHCRHRRRFHPDETWERRTQAYEHYHEDWRNHNGQFSEARGRGTLQDGGYHNHSRQQNVYNHSHARPLTTNERRPRPRARQGYYGRNIPASPFVVDSESGAYRPPRPSPQGRQGYDHRYGYPDNEAEARSGYGDSRGYRGARGSGNRGINRTGNSHQSFSECSQPSNPSGPFQEQPTNPGTWKAPPEWNGGNAAEDGRDAPRGSLRYGNDIQQRSPRDYGGNTWNNDAGPDIDNWVINDGCGTWKPPPGNDGNLRGPNRDDCDAPDPPVGNSNITHDGRETWINSGARDQPGARPGNRKSDTNRSNQRGGNTIHSSRENGGNVGGWKIDNQSSLRSNWGGSENNRYHGNSSKQGGNMSNERGNIEGNWGGVGEKDGRGNQESTLKEGGNSRGNDQSSKRGGSMANRRGYNSGDWNGAGGNEYHCNLESAWKVGGNDQPIQGGIKSSERGYNRGDWSRGGETDHHRIQESSWKEGGNSKGNDRLSKRGGSKPNERGYNDGCWNGGGNDNHSNNGRDTQRREGENINRSNTGQGNIESGDGGNKGHSNGEGSGWNRGSVNGNRPNADQGHSKSMAWGSGNNSNHGISRHGGGNTNLPNHGGRNHDRNGKDNRSTNGGGSKGRGGSSGKSNHRGSAWGGGGVNNSENPVRPNSGTSGCRASSDYARSNRADKTASHEVSNNEDGGWGGGETGRGHGGFGAASVNNIWGNSNTGEDRSGGNGNGNNDCWDGRDNGGGWSAGDHINGNAERWNGSDNKAGAWNDNNGNTNPRDGNCENGGGNEAWNDSTIPGAWGGENGNDNKEDWNNDNYQDPNSNAANYWSNAGNDNENGDNVDLDVSNYQTNGDPGNGTSKVNETNIWNQPPPDPTNNWSVDPATEETISFSHSSVELSLPYAKPYWSSWEAGPECVQSPTEPNTGRKRADSLGMGDEMPLYSIHTDQLRNRSASHQVHHGRPAHYARKLRKPVYLDSMEEPYAVFVFKYRSKEALELLLKVPIADDKEDEKTRLMRLSKDEIIDEFLRMKASVGPNESAGGGGNTAAENKDASGSGGGEW